MYKLLLVSDREEVLNAFGQVHNWEYNGFRKPHIRHDFEGAEESLKIHHADGIAIALDPPEEERLLAFLQEKYPLLPIFEAGRTPEEVCAYLGELNALLNRIRADFSSDGFNEQEMMIQARRHFFRKLVGGEKITCREMYRGMRLRRSRMDPDRVCVLMNLQRLSGEEDHLPPAGQDDDHLLERALFQSFGGDLKGFHVLPLVTEDGGIYVLAGQLHSEPEARSADQVTAVLDACVKEGIRHAEEYQGIRLRVTGIQVLPSLYALCSDYQG